MKVTEESMHVVCAFILPKSNLAETLHDQYLVVWYIVSTDSG